MRAYAVPWRRTCCGCLDLLCSKMALATPSTRYSYPMRERLQMHPRMLFPFGVGVQLCWRRRTVAFVMPAVRMRATQGFRAARYYYSCGRTSGWPWVDLLWTIEAMRHSTTASMTTMGRLWARFGCAPVRYVVHSDVYKQKQNCILHCNSVIHAYCRGLGPMSRQDVRIRASSSRLIGLWPKMSYGSHIVQPLWEVVLLMGCLLCARRTRLCGIRQPRWSMISTSSHTVRTELCDSSGTRSSSRYHV